jgi:uncharacterized membrane protein
MEVPAHRLDVCCRVDLRRAGGCLSGVVARTGDVRAMRRILTAEDRFAPIGGGILLLGLISGFVTAIVGDFDLTQPWLLIAYGLVAYILLTAFLYHAPQAAKLKAAVEASPDQETSEELRALARAPLGNVVNAIDGLAWLGVIFVMVTKPLS